MRSLIVRNEAIRVRAHEAVDQIKIDKDHPVEVRIQPYENIRTLPQNARYWARLTKLLKRIGEAVHQTSEYTGYSPLEVKRLLSATMPPEYAAILFIRSEESVHDVIKGICDIPTSTRLGTKKFSAFDERMESAMAEIEGYVNAFEREVAA